MARDGGYSTHCSDKRWGPQSAENLINTPILTEQVLLQGLGTVQVDVVLLKDILEQLCPLREAVGQAQKCETHSQLREPGSLQDYQQSQTEQKPENRQWDLIPFYSIFPASK